MKIITIPKRNGKSRTIYVPNDQEKSALRSLAGKLEKKARRASPENVVHGFMCGRSPVTNAESHVGYKYSLSFDLEDFFDHVDENKVSSFLTKEEKSLCLVDGAARQGLPTSPAIANLAAVAIDKSIIKWQQKKKLQFIYTRYADDLTFSYDDPQLTDLIRRIVPQIVGRCNFKINKKKTLFQSAARGRRIITGIAVDDTIHPTRAAKRRLRAARHQKNKNRARGLAEWCRLIRPKQKNDNKEYQGEEVACLCKAWRLSVKINKLPEKKDIRIGNNFIITGDPVYMLGASTYTTGWLSCYRQPMGLHRKTPVYLCYVSGVRVAAYLSRTTMTVAGVQRRVMRSRCLVYDLRNGQKAYGKLYGNVDDNNELIRQLKAHGYVPISNVPKGTLVVGHGPATGKLWFDDVVGHITKATKGVWAGRKVRTLRTK